MKHCAECGVELEDDEMRLCDSCQFESDIAAEELSFDHPSFRARQSDDEHLSSWDDIEDEDDENLNGNEEAYY